jgi:hypothetical protein|tara:strand:- start:769 stop:975 length:207 start_codon:yes stop_codon:yes gene_type:complete
MTEEEIENQVKVIMLEVDKRRLAGRLKYGNDLEGRDVLEEAVEELEDTINYCLFEIIKLKNLKNNLTK